jgi:hypothetical protein
MSSASQTFPSRSIFNILDVEKRRVGLIGLLARRVLNLKRWKRWKTAYALQALGLYPCWEGL